MFDFVITPAVIIGGVNTVITVGKSLYGMRQLNSFESLVKQLDSISVIKPGKIPTEESKQDQFVADLLHKSEFITPGLRRQVLSRLTYSVLILLVSSAAIAVDVPGKDVFKIKGLEWWDLILVGIQVLVIVSNSKLILTDTEKTYLKYVSRMHDYFYKKYVLRAMFRFNETAKYINFMDQAVEDQNIAASAIKKVLATAIAKGRRLPEIESQPADELDKLIDRLFASKNISSKSQRLFQTEWRNRGILQQALILRA